MSPKPCWRRIAFPDSGKVVTDLDGCAPLGEGGPASFKLGKRVMYRRVDVEKWLEEAR